MELKDIIINRRSTKQINQDTTVDDVIVKEVIETSAFAPNHGMREPWRVIWIKKDRLKEYGEIFGDAAFKNQPDKKQDHIETIQKLSGILLIVGKRDRRQKENIEDVLAIGAFMQNLSLLFYERNVGTCIKTPPVLWTPQLNEQLKIYDDELIYSQVYLTENIDQPVKVRKNINLIQEF